MARAPLAYGRQRDDGDDGDGDGYGAEQQPRRRGRSARHGERRRRRRPRRRRRLSLVLSAEESGWWGAAREPAAPLRLSPRAHAHFDERRRHGVSRVGVKCRARRGGGHATSRRRRTPNGRLSVPTPQRRCAEAHRPTHSSTSSTRQPTTCSPARLSLARGASPHTAPTHTGP